MCFAEKLAQRDFLSIGQISGLREYLSPFRETLGRERRLSNAFGAYAVTATTFLMFPWRQRQIVRPAKQQPLVAKICIVYISPMNSSFHWSEEKNEELITRYGFGFERVMVALGNGALLIDRSHPNVERYGHQRQLIVEIEGYAWVVPVVREGQKSFFKTMFPSRKATRRYLGQDK